MALKDWRGYQNIYINEKEKIAIEWLKGKHKWQSIGSHEEDWIKVNDIGFQVSVTKNLEQPYPIYTRYFKNKSMALKYIKNYMRTH